MDEFTRKHFDLWCREQVVNEQLKAAMLKEFELDSEYWSGQDYWKLYDTALLA
jgi:hypothetical protein